MIAPNIYDELVLFRDDPFHRADGPTEMIKYLCSQKYLRVIENDVRPDITIVPVGWEITVEGLTALSEFEQERDQEAQQKGNRRKERIFQVFLVLLGAVLGQFIEHFPEIARAISALLAGTG